MAPRFFRGVLRSGGGVGSDFLMDGGVTASYYFGELAPTVINCG